MASTSDIKNGLVIRHNHDIFEVVEFLHVKPGKGAAFVRTKLKSLTSGKVLDNTFPSGSKLEEVNVENRTYQYLYPQDDEILIFMHTESFEQIPVQKLQVPAVEYLKEGMECQLVFDADEEKILKVQIPTFVEVEITYTEPGLKGDTATNTLKPATIETGAEIRVPLFIDTGERIKVDTRDGSYVERVKS